MDKCGIGIFCFCSFIRYIYPIVKPGRIAYMVTYPDNEQIAIIQFEGQSNSPESYQTRYNPKEFSFEGKPHEHLWKNDDGRKQFFQLIDAEYKKRTNKGNNLLE